MTDLGVRYVMVRTEEAKKEAAADDRLQLVDTSGPWEIYELADASIVEALSVQPVVVEARGGDQRERNLEVGTSWFQRRDDWPAMPADDGPEEWQRVPVEIDMEARVGEPDDRSRNVDYVVPADPIDVVDLPAVAVTDVEVGEESVTFSVDQIGVPVLVRVSYFPNWEVSGAEGPYRVAPNFMVVVPTSNEVTLTYGRSSLDVFFYGLTLIGILLCFYWRWRGDVVYPDDDRLAGADADDDPDDPYDGHRADRTERVGFEPEHDTDPTVRPVVPESGERPVVPAGSRPSS
jgi:hypothetical protein